MDKKNYIKPLPDGRKCLNCPYYLGYIKCIISPCRECIMNKRKTHPFANRFRDKQSSKL